MTITLTGAHDIHIEGNRFMNSPADEELRARLIELAARSDPYGAVKLATEYLAFVKGETDLTPRQKIDAALEAAGVI